MRKLEKMVSSQHHQTDQPQRPQSNDKLNATENSTRKKKD